MKRLKHIRVVLALLMLAECVAFVLLGVSAPAHARVAGAIQLSASKLTGALATSAGAWIIWMVVTLLLGRVYCASFCPAGVLQDVVSRGMSLVFRRPLRYRKHEGRAVRWWVLTAYAGAVVAGIGVVALLVDPWPAFMNVVEQVSGHGSDARAIAGEAGLGLLAGFVCGLVSLFVFVGFALATGRDFCNDVCPVGSILALASGRSAMHIELYPDRCTGCLACEDVCKAGCIDIKSRRVDNARCVRCFNCVAECGEDAIRYQLNPNGIITPMFRRTRTTPT